MESSSLNIVRPNLDTFKRLMSSAALKSLLPIAVLNPLATGCSSSNGKNYQKVIKVQAKSIPAKLPSAVREDYAAVQKVFFFGHRNGLGTEGTAVKIGSDLDVSAGHVVLEHNLSHDIYCPYSFTIGEDTTIGQENKIINWRAQEDTENDFSLIYVRPNSAFKALPSVETATSTPKKGSIVYFIDYQKSSNDADHYPNRVEMNALKTPGKNSYDRAAEYAGVVLGKYGRELKVATGLQPYGFSNGKVSNPSSGSSGALVANQYGKMVGEEVGYFGGPESMRAVRKQYGVSLNLSSGRRLRINYVQSVTQGILGQFKYRQQPRHIC